jgi:hypothetical protein
MIQGNIHWWERLNEQNQVGASAIMSNNIIVTIRVFALGALFGVGAFYDLAFEGARLGSVLRLATNSIRRSATRLRPLSSATALSNCLASFLRRRGNDDRLCIDKPRRSDARPGVEEKRDASSQDRDRLCVFLVVAGTIEGFSVAIRPAAAVKIATGVGTGIALYSYLLFAGRSEDQRQISIVTTYHSINTPIAINATATIRCSHSVGRTAPARRQR